MDKHSEMYWHCTLCNYITYIEPPNPDVCPSCQNGKGPTYTHTKELPFNQPKPIPHRKEREND